VGQLHNLEHQGRVGGLVPPGAASRQTIPLVEDHPASQRIAASHTLDLPQVVLALSCLDVDHTKNVRTRAEVKQTGATRAARSWQVPSLVLSVCRSRAAPLG
jgi:hypothetical protein